MGFLPIDTPFGPMALLGEKALEGLFLPGRPTPRLAVWETPLLREAKGQLAAYFAGALREFSLPLSPAGTPFQQDVWRAMGEVGYGETASYEALARRAGHPRALRAVGTACGANPLPIFIPCHRITQKTGRPGGYAGGTALKVSLLALERGDLPHYGGGEPLEDDG